MLCILNLQKTLSTFAVYSNNFFSGISLTESNFSFCLLSNTSTAEVLFDSGNLFFLKITNLLIISASSAVKIFLLSYYLNHQHFSFLSCNYRFQLSSFPVLLFLTQSTNCSYIFSGSTSPCSDAQNIPLFNHKLSMCFL